MSVCQEKAGAKEISGPRFLTLLAVMTLTISLNQKACGGSDGYLKKPNIIVFLVDDLGWQDSSVPFSSKRTVFQDHFRTPHLEQLSKRGVRLTRAYAHCVCSPTRTSILTGQNPARHRVTNWTLYSDRDQSGKSKRLRAPDSWRKEGLQPSDITLPQLLKQAGYQTIHCGKAHWGAIGTAGSDPCQLGFDINIAGHSAGGPGSYQGTENYGNHPDGTPKKPWGVPGLEKYHGTPTHLTDALTTEACAAVDAAVDSQQPFFLYMAPYAVHAPIQPHPRFIDHYRNHIYSNNGQPIPEAEARYASMVEGYDAALGALMDKLRDRNVADRTIILFTSDNGGLSVHSRDTTPKGTGKDTHNWPLREGKGSAYEGGIRVPAIISWATPDRGSPLQRQIPIKGNSTCATPFISEDIFPTVCRWADVNLEKQMTSTLDGRDVTDHLATPDPSESRPYLFHYPHIWGPQGEGYQPHSSLRLGPWKIIYFYDPVRWELYNLQQDVGEINNLAETNPVRLAKMKTQLIFELEKRNAQYPIEIGSGQPRRPQ